MGSSRLRTAGWLMHVGKNKHGKEYCNPRYVVLEGRTLSFFKNDPNGEDQAPSFTGQVGPYNHCEELGRQLVLGHCLYTFRVYNSVNHAVSGQLGAASAEEVSIWLKAFAQARDQAIEAVRAAQDSKELENGTDERSSATDLGAQPSLTRTASVGLGVPALFLDQAHVADLQDAGFDVGDVFTGGDWRLLKLENGLRIFQDDSDMRDMQPVLKAVGVIEAPAEAIFRLAMSLDKRTQQFDPVLRDWRSIEVIDGHTDVVHAIMETKICPRFVKPRDFCLARYWRRDEDGAYSIIFHSVDHDNCEATKGFVRCKQVHILSWEITPLPPHPVTKEPRSLCEHLVGIELLGWKSKYYKDFVETVQRRLLTRVAGMREYFLARPEEAFQTREGTAVQSTIRQPSDQVPLQSTAEGGEEKNPLFEMEEVYYDAEEPQDVLPRKVARKHATMKHAAFVAIAIQRASSNLSDEDNPQLKGSPIALDASLFKGTLHRTSPSRSKDCYGVPPGSRFKVRGKTYNKDSIKTAGGEPLLQLLAVDWFESGKRMDHVSRSPSSAMQSTEGKKAPFVFVVNLQVPGTPCRSLAMYFAADRKIASGSLLDKFANRDDNFRNKRFKLVPSIEKGPFLVKRAVGSKACLLGQALTCNWYREANYLEMDVDIGSSSVAKHIVGLVIGYVTGLIVDLAVLIQGEDEETELPEYILGAIRIQYLTLTSAVPYRHP